MTARDELRAHLVTGSDEGMRRADELIGDFRAEVLRKAASELRTEADRLWMPGRTAHTVMHADAAHLDDMAGKVTPSGGEATQPADFYRPGHTYGDDEYGWAFRCDSITAHPADGERTALGWRLFKGQWEPYAYGEDDWEIHQVVGMTEDDKDGAL